MEGPIEEISRKKVEIAPKNMQNRRSGEPSGVTADLLNFAGSSGTDLLLVVFNKVLTDCRIPEQLIKSLTVLIYKRKGNPLQCSKHRGLRLLEHSMKIFEKILDRRLRSLTDIMDGQCGFRPGKSCADAIFILRRM